MRERTEALGSTVNKVDRDEGGSWFQRASDCEDPCLSHRSPCSCRYACMYACTLFEVPNNHWPIQTFSYRGDQFNPVIWLRGGDLICCPVSHGFFFVGGGHTLKPKRM